MNQFEQRLDRGACVNCGERASVDGGVLCGECRSEMWSGERTHHGRLDLDRSRERRE